MQENWGIRRWGEAPPFASPLQGGLRKALWSFLPLGLLFGLAVHNLQCSRDRVVLGPTAPSHCAAESRACPQPRLPAWEQVLEDWKPAAPAQPPKGQESSRKKVRVPALGCPYAPAVGLCPPHGPRSLGGSQASTHRVSPSRGQHVGGEQGWGVFAAPLPRQPEAGARWELLSPHASAAGSRSHGAVTPEPCVTASCAHKHCGQETGVGGSCPSPTGQSPLPWAGTCPGPF